MDQRSLRNIAERRGLPLENLRRRFHVSAQTIRRCPPHAPFPSGPLILIVDALHCDCEQSPVTIPILLLRAVHERTAVLAVIDALPGGESLQNWETALAHIPLEVQERIIAMVSDDHRGLLSFAAERHWVHQVCTFHVKARFHHWLPRRKNARAAEAKRLVFAAAKCICDARDLRKVRTAIRTLQQYGRHPDFDPLLQKNVRGLSRDWRKCRTYLEHPELHLPDTSNVVECMGSSVRKMLAKRRGFRTLKSLKQWLSLFQKTHPTVMCNEAKSLQN